MSPAAGMIPPPKLPIAFVDCAEQIRLSAAQIEPLFATALCAGRSDGKDRGERRHSQYASHLNWPPWAAADLPHHYPRAAGLHYTQQHTHARSAKPDLRTF